MRERNEKLARARRKAGLTQLEIADEAQISDISYRRYELGLREPPVGVAIDIAEALGITSMREFRELFQKPPAQ